MFGVSGVQGLRTACACRLLDPDACRGAKARGLTKYTVAKSQWALSVAQAPSLQRPRTLLAYPVQDTGGIAFLSLRVRVLLAMDESDNPEEHPGILPNVHLLKGPKPPRPLGRLKIRHTTQGLGFTGFRVQGSKFRV